MWKNMQCVLGHVMCIGNHRCVLYTSVPMCANRTHRGRREHIRPKSVTPCLQLADSNGSAHAHIGTNVCALAVHIGVPMWYCSFCVVQDSIKKGVACRSHADVIPGACIKIWPRSGIQTAWTSFPLCSSNV
jgi:hypothetical protein